MSFEPAIQAAATKPQWQASLPLTELASDSLTVWKHEGRAYVIARTAEDEFHVLDNRCPHEGYPLSSGDLKGTALTCCWHNWKFDVRSGACTLGEEGVRRFETRVRNGQLEVDLAEPDPKLSWPWLLESFDEGLFEHQVARGARDGVRLLKAGFEAPRLLARIALYDARHAEYGSTHTLAVAADCGRYLRRYRGVDAMHAIAPAMDMCGEANRRLPARERHPAIPAGQAADLRQAVEEEDAPRALGILRGAFEEGRNRQELETWLFAVLSDHFLDFGHQLIYLIKAQELLDLAGDEHADEIYEGLLYGILLGTREDTLPYMSGYSRRFEARAANLEELWRGAGQAKAFDPRPLRDAALDGSLDEAFERLMLALESGAELKEIAGALVAAAAHRLARFDVPLDSDPMVSETWLWATHRLTFASAVRNAVQRFEQPDAIRFLLQALAFVHSGRGMDAPPERRVKVEPRSMDVSAILQAIVNKDRQLALNGSLAALAIPESERELRLALEDLVLQDGPVRPIVVVHLIKTLLAAFEEFDAMGDHEDRVWPVLAMVRLLASPVQERRVHEQVTRSIRWVDEGIMPRKLTQ